MWEKEGERDKKSGRTRRKSKKTQRDRKSSGDPTPRSRRRHVRGGINSWIQLLSRAFVAAARVQLSLWRQPTVFFSPSLFLSPSTTLTPFHRNLDAVLKCLPHLQQTVWQTKCTNEISAPAREREPYKPIFLPRQMWAGNPSSRLLSHNFSSQSAWLRH